MKKVFYEILIALLYFISFGLFSIYITCEFKTNFGVATFNKLFLLISCSLSLYLGSTLYYHIFNNKNIIKISLWIIFAFYLLLLINLVLLDPVYGRNNTLLHSINIIPFKTIVEYIIDIFNHDKTFKTIIINLLGNILAFMPFAFFLPTLIKKINNTKVFLIIMSTIVLTVEILQLITRSGTLDIDDLILNVTGTLIMYKILDIDIIKNTTNKGLN